MNPDYSNIVYCVLFVSLYHVKLSCFSLLRISAELIRFSKCQHVLNVIIFLFQIDNKGNHLLVSEEASINVPAIAAAHVTKRYTAQATDELTFEVRLKRSISHTSDPIIMSF